MSYYAGGAKGKRLADKCRKLAAAKDAANEEEKEHFLPLIEAAIKEGDLRNAHDLASEMSDFAGSIFIMGTLRQAHELLIAQIKMEKKA